MHATKWAILILATLITAQANAQWGSKPQRGHRQGFDPVTHLTEALQLTQTQAEQLSEVMQEARSQHARLRGADSSEICASRAQTENRISEILSEEQMTEFKALRNQQESRRGQGRGRGQRQPVDYSNWSADNEPDLQPAAEQ